VLKGRTGSAAASVAELEELTERKRVEQTLKTEETPGTAIEWRRALIENASDGVALLDDKRMILYESPSAESILGQGPEQLEGTSFPDLIQPDDMQQATSLFASVTENHGKTVTCQLRVKHKDGSWRTVEAKAQNLLRDPKIGGIVVNYRDITERKLAEERLARLNQQHELILCSVAEGVLGLDLQGNHTFVNPAAAKMLGCEVEELLGQPSHSSWHHTKPDGTPYPREECQIYAAYREGTVRRESTEVFWRKDGTNFPVEYASTPIYERGRPVGVVLTFADITERKLAEERLARLNQQHELILCSVAEGILGLDLQGNHTFVNPAAAKMLGCEVEELLGRPSHSTWHHTKPDGTPYPRKGCQIYAAYREGTVYRASTEVFWRKDGTSFPVEYASTPMYERGRPVGAVLTFVDITERKRAEKRLEYVSSHDALSGLYNRAYFEGEFGRLELDRRFFPVSVVMADVDGMKAVNDTKGHEAGDVLLRRAATVLIAAFRAEDVVCRIGGDEFAVLLPGADRSAAEKALTRVREILATHNSNVHGIPLSLSIGAATGEEGCKLAEIMREADNRMYQEKQAKKAGARNVGDQPVR